MECAQDAENYPLQNSLPQIVVSCMHMKESADYWKLCNMNAAIIIDKAHDQQHQKLFHKS